MFSSTVDCKYPVVANHLPSITPQQVSQVFRIAPKALGLRSNTRGQRPRAPRIVPRGTIPETRPCSTWNIPSLPHLPDGETAIVPRGTFFLSCPSRTTSPCVGTCLFSFVVTNPSLSAQYEHGIAPTWTSGCLQFPLGRTVGGFKVHSPCRSPMLAT